MTINSNTTRSLNPHPGKSGLTLVEVMIALAMLGIGMVALIAGASRCLAVIRQARHYERARHLLAIAEAENPLQLEEEIEEGSDGDRFKSPYNNYSWKREVFQATEDEEDYLFEVHWTVSWSDRGKNAFEKVVTYIYAPEEALPGTAVR